LAASQANQELKSLLAKRDTENLRLRETREQQAAELLERKQKDTVKLASFEELKNLAESRSERILALQSELNRHKAHLAANAGNEDLMKFFFVDQGEDVSYIADLQSRLAYVLKPPFYTAFTQLIFPVRRKTGPLLWNKHSLFSRTSTPM
jgi:E3 ubiquitin-protein ligase BRE1